MLLKCNTLFDILYRKEDLTLNKTLWFLHLKETELLNMILLKEKTAHYTSKSGRGSFWRRKSYWVEPRDGSLASSRILFPQALIKSYVCQEAHIFKDCPIWLAKEDSHK